MSGRRARQIRQLADDLCREHGVTVRRPGGLYAADKSRSAAMVARYPRLLERGSHRLARSLRRHYVRHGSLPVVVVTP